MKRVLFICVVWCFAPDARAQTRVYVSGDLFAEITRMSRVDVAPAGLLSSSTSPDGVTAGGGGRIGAFFSPQWSLELGVDLGRTISRTESLSVPIPIGLGITIPTPRFQSRANARFDAMSILLGYHPFAGGRLHPGFRGGVSLMRSELLSTTANISTIVLTPFPTLTAVAPPQPTVSVATTDVTYITNGITATLAAEAAIDLSRHFAVAPEMRVHAGGLGGFVLRPGVALRWLW